MVTAKRKRARMRAISLFLAGAAGWTAQAPAQQREQATLVVSASIAPGCRFGTGQGAQSSLGTLDFGTVFNLDKDVQAQSTVGGGSIVMTCTPGTQFRVDINDGRNTSGWLWNYSGRQLKHVSSAAVLSYDLFQDSAYSRRWGTGSAGLSMGTASGVVELPVYAKLSRATALPAPGEYTDELIVTVYY